MKCKYEKRVFVSYDTICPMKCKHCYTYELELREKPRTADELVKSLTDEIFDIIYVSKSYENFYDEEKGILLCESLWEKFHKDIFIITRRRLSDSTLAALARLNQQMRIKGNGLYLGVSVSANDSASILENQNFCPTSLERISNLERAKASGIKTLLLLRPLLPDNIIPVEEPLQLIEKSKEFVDAVISSGLIVTDQILHRMNLSQDNLKYLEKGDSDYLADLHSHSIRYVDVREEIQKLRECCSKNKVPFFEHSMPALNGIRYVCEPPEKVSPKTK